MTINVAIEMPKDRKILPCSKALIKGVRRREHKTLDEIAV